MSQPREKMFVTEDGRNVAFVFALVSSLFLLWGFLNGMIDVMDKHFQEELKLTLSQSAWVQFAHWMGYFLMSIPAGWLATRLEESGQKQAAWRTDPARSGAGGCWRFVSSGEVPDREDSKHHPRHQRRNQAAKRNDRDRVGERDDARLGAVRRGRGQGGSL